MKLQKSVLKFLMVRESVSRTFLSIIFAVKFSVSLPAQLRSLKPKVIRIKSYTETIRVCRHIKTLNSLSFYWLNHQVFISSLALNQNCTCP